jgi:acyl-CoA thioester hydrolase
MAPLQILRLLHEATVAEEEIDHLGHMNVRFYLEKALAASWALAAEHGVSPKACREMGASLELRDVFTRHYREQLGGAQLIVMGGVLAVQADGLRLYHELLNPERDERAATFVHEMKLRDLATRAPRPLPEMLAKSAGNARVEWPVHGRPRTLDLQRLPPVISLEEVRKRGLAVRAERLVRSDECDAQGFFIASNYQDLVWGGDPGESRLAGVPVFETEGGKFGWAVLESRGVVNELPRAGARIQSFGAEVELGRKTSFRHHWVFDVESGTPLCTSSILNLAFDLGARRAIEIPPALRETLEVNHHPDLR